MYMSVSIGVDSVRHDRIVGDSNINFVVCNAFRLSCRRISWFSAIWFIRLCRWCSSSIRMSLLVCWVVLKYSCCSLLGSENTGVLYVWWFAVGAIGWNGCWPRATRIPSGSGLVSKEGRFFLALMSLSCSAASSWYEGFWTRI